MMDGKQTFQRPVVSVILPTFNRLHYLHLAVDSVFAQTYRDWELIIADDGSDTETRAYLSSLAAQPNVKVLWLPHRGNPGAARNSALREAQGEYLAFLDSDDLWMPSKLELQVAALRACPGCQWSYTAINHINAAGEQINAELSAGWVYYDGQVFDPVLAFKAGIAMPTVMVTRQLLEQVGGFDEQQGQHEDYHLWLRLAMRCEISVLRQPLACVRCHDEHFSRFGINSIEAKDRMLEKIQPLAITAQQRAAVRAERARNAAALAAAKAVAGSAEGARRALADSWRYSWRYPVWWAGVARVFANLYLPARLTAAIRTHRSASVLLALWHLLDRHQRRQLVGLQLLSVVMGLSTVGGIAAVLPFFTALADPDAMKHNAVLGMVLNRVHFDDTGSFVIALGVAFAVMVLAANAINLLGFLALNRFAMRVGDSLFVRLFNEYMHRDYVFHTRSNSSELATKVLQETARVTSGILQQGLILVTNLVTIIFITAAIVFVNPVVAVVAIVTLGASYAAIYVAARGRLLRNGQIESRHYAERSRTVNESFRAIKEVTIAQARGFFVERFAQQSRSISRAAGNTVAIAQGPRYVLECITVFCLVSVALYLRSRTDTAGPWMAQLSFVGFAAYRILPALQQVFAAIVKIRADRPAFAGIEADLRRARPETRTPQVVAPDPAWRGRPRSQISLCEVSFRYESDRAAAISEVSLVIPAGAIVGFAGPNGSGKTTLLDLVSGLLAPQSGHIEVDGVRLDDGNCVAWQSIIAYVPQHVFLFDATLAENIAVGVPRSQIDRQRLESAVQLARLSECVAGLPNGCEELMGEGGCRLSGGQRQRLAIARALYRDASLLILDEATSALDTAAEGQIGEMLESLRSNRTILIIAHRSAALRHCDVVFELHNGKLTGSRTLAQVSSIARQTGHG